MTRQPEINKILDKLIEEDDNILAKELMTKMKEEEYLITTLSIITSLALRYRPLANKLISMVQP